MFSCNGFPKTTPFVKLENGNDREMFLQRSTNEHCLVEKKVDADGDRNKI